MIKMLQILLSGHWTDKRTRLNKALDDLNAKTKEVVQTIEEKSGRNIGQTIHNLTRKRP
jgi:hypothetical protein